MNNNRIKMNFKIERYNLISKEENEPTEMNLTLSKYVNIEDNFMEVIESVAHKYMFNENFNYYLEDIYHILWSEYFSDGVLEKLLKRKNVYDYDMLNTKVELLNKQFNLENKEIKIIISENKHSYFMRFFFHINSQSDKIRPHVHCKCCGLERIIDLTTLEFIEQSFISPNLSNKALNVVHLYKSELMNYWNNLIQNQEELIEFNLLI